jgi:hypothetical protein
MSNHRSAKGEKMKTRQQLFEELSEKIGELAAKAVCIATASQRHWERVTATVLAAEEWVNAHIYTPVQANTLAAVAIAVDLGGIGGTANATGEATSRHPAFSALGKGRKQSSDGGAWMAAAEGALERLTSSWPLEVSVLRGRVVVCLGNHHGEGEEILLAATAPACWLRAEATRAAVAASGFVFAKPKLVWQDEAIELAFQECEFLDKDEKLSSWREKAKTHTLEEFEAWVNAPGDCPEELSELNRAMEVLGFGYMPEPGAWPDWSYPDPPERLIEV